MSEKLKVLSGKEVVKIFEKYGSVVKRITGSHTRLSCSGDGETRNITVPLHNELKRGTLKSIADDFKGCFGEVAMRKEFYHK